MFDQIAAAAGAARTPSERLRAYARAENAACAARLSAMADMLESAQAADGSADRESWRLDNWAAVCAQIGAVHEVTSGVASGLLMDAITLRERLPRVGALLAEGLISYRQVHLICTRTMLVQDPDALAAIDTDLATELRGRGAMSVNEAERAIDALVNEHDPYAVRRTEREARECHADVYFEDSTGIAHLSGAVLGTDGKAFDQRLDALAATTCSRDPRNLDQRRAAAIGAVGFGWDRLPCLCEQPDCDATDKPAGGGVIIHVIAHADTVDTSPSAAPTPQPPTTPQPDGGPEPESRSEPEAEAEPEPAVGDLTAQRRALVGEQPPLLPQPWYSYTWSGLITALNADPGQYCPARPAVILGGGVLPAPVAAHAAIHATTSPLIHPGHAPPEPRYRPSKALAKFVRCRDLTCRFPGCTRPATAADLDHTIPWPYGPTCASNVKCLCREHHLLKTFWPGWRDQQYPDGTIVWTDPDGHTYTTHPGSRLLFPELCTPTAAVIPTGNPPPKHTTGLTMPKRPRTRAQDRAQHISDERRHNETLTEAEAEAEATDTEGDPPPF